MDSKDPLAHNGAVFSSAERATITRLPLIQRRDVFLLTAAL